MRIESKGKNLEFDQKRNTFKVVIKEHMVAQEITALKRSQGCSDISLYFELLGHLTLGNLVRLYLKKKYNALDMIPSTVLKIKK